MSRTLQRIQLLIERGEIRISAHGYDEPATDAIATREAIAGVAGAVVVEDYPEYAKGPAVLVLQRERRADPRSVRHPNGEAVARGTGDRLSP